jgi:DNA-binding response OmpR family regulator
MKRTIMVVEDNIEMAELLSIFLGQEGFDTVCAGSAESALQYFSGQHIDLIVLDINLPGMDGFEFLGLLRKQSDVPVLILTARKTDQDVITGLGYGADDFISKPFSSAIVVARIRALLRRAAAPVSAGASEHLTSFGPYIFDASTLTLTRESVPVPLSMRECRLLDYLIKNAGKSRTPETIYSDVWKNMYGDVTIIAVYIQRLRRKIEADPGNPRYIQTMPGYGYCFCLPDGKELVV